MIPRLIIASFIFLFTLTSCLHQEKKDYIEEFAIIGHSGWCFKDSANWIFDSTRLDVREYFEFKKDSFLRIAYRKPFQRTEYFTISRIDSIGFEKLINSILSKQRFKSEYYGKADNTEIYDSLNYFLYYKMKSQKEFVIKYHPYHLPDSLKLIHCFVDSTISLKNLKQLEYFDFNKVIRKLATELFVTNPPPPRPLNGTIKFKPPVIMNDQNIKN